jgi:hypothetical protein
LSLNLDSTVSIPVIVSYTSSTAIPPLYETNAGSMGPPGKFYSKQAAMAVLDTLRTGGPSAKITIGTDATDDQKKHFEHFRMRLNAGELVRVLPSRM